MSTLWNNLTKAYGTLLEPDRKKAQDYLQVHPKADFYTVELHDYESDEDLSCLISLSDPELETLRSLAEKYDDPWTEYPAFSQRILEEVAPPINPVTAWEIENVDLTPRHCYMFSMVIQGEKDPASVERISRMITLEDEEYCALLTWAFLKKGMISFNKMRTDLPMLFEKISSALEYSFFPMSGSLDGKAYFVLMDELTEDWSAAKRLH